MNFQNKKILLIATAFFGYEESVSEKLKEMGAKVDYYNERSVSSAFARALLKITPNIFSMKTYAYYKSIVECNIEKDYDFVFCNGATMIDKKVIHMLKQAFSKAKFILYCADSVKGKKRFEKLFSEFDKVVSFDRLDCLYYKKELNINNVYFRPLYFLDCYRSKNEKVDKKYDLCFIGTVHSDRYRILKEIESFAKENNLNFYNYSYLQSKFMFYFYKIFNSDFKGAKFNDFQYKKINSQTIADIILYSKVIIDVQYPKNSGLTMRTIEMLGMKKKIMTTNKDIVNYDFYDSKNIHILDRNAIKLDVSFLKDEYVEVPENVYEKYTLESWLRDIFNMNQDEQIKYTKG